MIGRYQPQLQLETLLGRYLEAVEEQHEELQEQDSWAVWTRSETRPCRCY